MATYWSRKCGSCGYSVSGRVYSFSSDGTIGPPVTICPECNHVQKVKWHCEWVQMSTLMKLFCVTGYSRLVFVSVLVGSIAGLFIMGRVLGSESGVILFVGAMVGGILGSLLSYPFAVKSKAFLSAYAYSLYRTDNEAYRKLLDLPDITAYMTSIPFYTLTQEQEDEVAKIRTREHTDSAYYSHFNEP